MTVPPSGTSLLYQQAGIEKHSHRYTTTVENTAWLSEARDVPHKILCTIIHTFRLNWSASSSGGSEHCRNWTSFLVT